MEIAAGADDAALDRFWWSTFLSTHRLSERTGTGDQQTSEPPKRPPDNSRAYPFHPFLFAAASVLLVYAQNVREATFGEIAPTLAVVLGLALVVYLAFAAILRSISARTAVLASLVVVPCVFYAGLFGRLNDWLDGGYAMHGSLFVVLPALALLIVFVARTRSSLALTHSILNGIALVMLVSPVWEIVSFEWRNKGADSAYEDEIAAELADEPWAGVMRASAAPARSGHPDIYYFIFDRYGSAPMLAEHYGYDDSDLVRFLKEHGFYVASQSRSNYLKTAPSIASTFHMDYLNFLAEDPRVTPYNWRPIYDMLDDHRVARFLKGKGYEFIQFGSWWGPTSRNFYADESYSYGFTEFDMIYFRRTILRPLFHTILTDSAMAGRLHWDNGQCHRVPRKIAKLKEVIGRDGPTFVFAHFLIPHGPYIFNPDGSCLTPKQSLKRGSKQGYIAQLAYAGNIIRDLVTTILEREGPRPIIIVQADEGPFPEHHVPDWVEAPDSDLEIKTSILNAYYFPDGDYSMLDEQITPVNSFRMLFNKEFGTNFDRLPDRVYAFPDVFHLYDFTDVTDRVRDGGVPTMNAEPSDRPSNSSQL